MCIRDRIWADGERAPILEKLGDEFAAQTGVKLAVVQKAIGDIRNDFKIAAPAGSGPDIILGAHDWLGELNGSGLLAPVDPVSYTHLDVYKRQV